MAKHSSGYKKCNTDEILRALLCRVVCCCKKKRRKVERISTYTFKGISFTAKGKIMLNLKDTEVPGTVNVTVSFVDGKGKQAKVDGVPTWSASNTNCIDSVTPAADGMSATIHILDNVDSSLLTVNADVDMGAGVNNVDFTDTVSVLAGDAVAATFAFGSVTLDP